MKSWLLIIVALLVSILLEFVFLFGAADAEDRDPKQVTAFKKVNACPSTGIYGDKPCPGYIVDHKYPLCLGGKDMVENMIYQTTADSFIKDRLEREACKWKTLYEELKAKSE